MGSGEALIARLKGACDEAYDLYPDSCSHAAWHVIKTAGNAPEPYRTANELIGVMNTTWAEVELGFGLSLANLGKIVVGGKSEFNHGHVVVIYPGDKIYNGGYQYFWKKGNKYLTMPRKDLYPRCLSTSIGSWPGAMSKGDKTVWDPWADNQKFSEVRFWTPSLTT